MDTDNLIPVGFVEIKVQSAFVNRSRGELILLGIPQDDHDCDEMGCGSLDHVVLRVTSNSLRTAEQRNVADAPAHKCPICSGRGYLKFMFGSPFTCYYCNGTGIYKSAGRG